MNFVKKLFIGYVLILPTLGMLASQVAPSKKKKTAIAQTTQPNKKRAKVASNTANYISSESASGVGRHEESAQAKSSDANETVSAHSSATATTPAINTSSSANSSTATIPATHDQEQKKEKESKSDDTVKKYCEQLKQLILKTYNPTEESCRPRIRAATNVRGYVEVESLLQDDVLEPTLACILAGHKDVGHVEMPETNSDIPKEIKELCEKENISIIQSPRNCCCYLLCTREGMLNAYLAYKYYYLSVYKLEELGIHCPYSYGYFYGYSEEDIKAYYLYANNADSFETDKKTFLAWVEENTPNIDDWVEAHPPFTPEQLLLEQFFGQSYE